MVEFRLLSVNKNVSIVFISYSSSEKLRDYFLIRRPSQHLYSYQVIFVFCRDLPIEIKQKNNWCPTNRMTVVTVTTIFNGHLRRRYAQFSNSIQLFILNVLTFLSSNRLFCSLSYRLNVLSSYLPSAKKVIQNE